MKIIADDKIPFLKGLLEPFANVLYLPGQAISNSHLIEADALLIRTRTQCDEKLLKNTTVKFIGTATIGYDHIDTRYCDNHGIAWRNAPGCNASSVNQYVASSLVELGHKFNFSLKDRTLGVVGVGNVGSIVVYTAEMLGMHVYLCDPPRVREEGICGFISLDGIIRECDIITFHVPLNHQGPDRTFKMIDHELLNRVRPGTFIINTSRGDVADGNALKEAIRNRKIAGAILDVWENEPDIDTELLQMAVFGTPHIAGYSSDGKARGTAMIIHELSRNFNLGLEDWEPSNIPGPLRPVIQIDCKGLSPGEVLAIAIIETYNITEDDNRLRKSPASFDKQREDYPLRREFKAYMLELSGASPEINRICRRMGFKVKLQPKQPD